MAENQLLVMFLLGFILCWMTALTVSVGHLYRKASITDGVIRTAFQTISRQIEMSQYEDQDMGPPVLLPYWEKRHPE